MKKSCENGIVHLKDLPEEKVYVGLKEDDRISMMKALEDFYGEFRDVAKVLGTYKEMVSWFKHQRKYAVSLKLLRRICYALSNKGCNKFALEVLEKRLDYIKAKGTATCISKPKFPFDFNNESGGRILSAVLHDGSLSDRRFSYCNHLSSLKKRIYQDVRNVFGDIIAKVGFDMVRFPKVVHDVLVFGLGMKSGEKVLTDPHYPSFVFNSPKTWKAICDQAISDDGFVGHKSLGIVITIDTTTSKSKTPIILEQDKLIFEKLGFLANELSLYRRYKLSIKCREYIREQWHLSFYGKENLDRMFEIGVGHSKKKDKLESELSSYKQIQYKHGEKIMKTLEACKMLHKENQLLTYQNVASVIRRHSWRTSEIMKEMVNEGSLEVVFEYRNKFTPRVHGITKKGWNL